MGWLHSRPKLTKEPVKDRDGNNVPDKARIETLADDDLLKDMPEADSFIVGAWHELGMTESSGGERIPLTFNEIESYSNTACKLDPFEVMCVKKMSQLYLNEKYEATENKLKSSPMEIESLEFYNKLKTHNQSKISESMKALAQTGVKR